MLEIKSFEYSGLTKVKLDTCVYINGIARPEIGCDCCIYFKSGNDTMAGCTNKKVKDIAQDPICSFFKYNEKQNVFFPNEETFKELKQI